MKATFFTAAALAGSAAAQTFDPLLILNAPPVSLQNPPLAAVSAPPLTTNLAAVTSSIGAEVQPTTASVTGASASAAATQDPTSGINKRWFWNWWWKPHTTTSAYHAPEPTSTSVAAYHSPAATTTATTPPPEHPPTTMVTSTSSSTTSSSSACPTTPEKGTYCGFINPEDACAVQPDGYGPTVSPDTVQAFMDYQPFHEEALNAVAPSGYQEVFEDLDASVSANSYITFYTLKEYSPSVCAQHCDDTNLCTAFNLYIERDPSLNPNTNATDPAFNCPNPPAITNYKCSLFGSPISKEAATNTGGYRHDFQVVIVASNGYDKTNNTVPQSPPEYQPPQSCPNGAITQGGSYHVGSQFYPGPYDVSLCSTYAHLQTIKNREAAIAAGQHSYTPCNMFNAYMVTMNGKGQGTYCSLYNTPLSSKWANWGGAWSGSNYFDVESSFLFSLKNQDAGNC